MNNDNPELHLAEGFIQETGCNIFLTGKAGTGKTTFLHNLKEGCGKRMVVTAPTGVAAINCGGVTIHSLFQMPFAPFVPGSEQNRQYKFNREKISLLKSLDLLVIDEISMVRADLLDGVDTVLRRYRRSNHPFGGVQLLLIGDLHQLAPVVKNEDWRILGPYYDSPYFFSSQALSKTELLTIELQHIYRQADQRFINLLNQVRDNKLDRNTLNALNSRYIEDLDGKNDNKEGYITLCTHNRAADSINDEKLEELNQKSRLFEAEVEGEFPSHSFPTPPVLELKVGAQVMFVRNDSSYEKRYFNGKIGNITRISGDKIWIQCPDDLEEIIVEPATWENIEYSLNQDTMEVTESKVGAFTQYPLKLAWAITIHKSQGLTFDHAIIDAQAAFTHGQVYVALSRCRTLEGMFLSSPLSHNSIKTDKTVLQFTEGAGKSLPTEEKLEVAKIKYQQNLLLDCFDFQRLQYLMRRLVNQVEGSQELLRLQGIRNISDLHRETTENICQVGSNFGRQLQGLFNDDLLPSEDPVILERLQKASAYFQREMEKELTTCIPTLSPETDNKELRKQAKKAITRLQEEVAVKYAAVRSCESGFNVSLYFKAISEAEILAKKQPVKAPTITYTEGDIEHLELFKSLKTWRSRKAKSENLAAFQVMHQKTLIQIAVNLPDSIPALLKVKGIGEKLADRYGTELVEMVTTYRNDNKISEISLPELQQPPPAKEKPPSPKDSKKESLKLFREGKSVPEIAEERGLVSATIEGHLAHYVALGELSLENLVALEKQHEIENQLKENKELKLKEIKNMLGNDYSYGEIKLVLAHLEYCNS